MHRWFCEYFCTYIISNEKNNFTKTFYKKTKLSYFLFNIKLDMYAKKKTYYIYHTALSSIDECAILR